MLLDLIVKTCVIAIDCLVFVFRFFSTLNRCCVANECGCLYPSVIVYSNNNNVWKELRSTLEIMFFLFSIFFLSLSVFLFSFFVDNWSNYVAPQKWCGPLPPSLNKIRRNRMNKKKKKREEYRINGLSVWNMKYSVCLIFDSHTNFYFHTHTHTDR